MSELGALIERAQKLQPRTFTPDPVGLERPRNAKGWARRQTLRALERELEEARISRPEWYVWVTEDWPAYKQARNSDAIKAVEQVGPFTG